jgi:hypothetical protein
MAEVFNLDRHTNIQNNIDPRGKRWEIQSIKGSSLYKVVPNPHNGSLIPDELDGTWTKPVLLQARINAYLAKAWDHSEACTQKAERKAYASGKKAKDEPSTDTTTE